MNGKPIRRLLWLRLNHLIYYNHFMESLAIVTKMNWRAAVKAFDLVKKVSDEDFAAIVEAARLSPSSLGLQPWKFVVVKNPEVRAKLREAGYGQPQFTEASHVIVFASKIDLPLTYVDQYIQDIATTRDVDLSTLDSFKQMILGSVAGKSPQEIEQWNARQVYVPLGVVLAASAFAGVDACPMEGFDAVKFDEILGLDKLGFKSRAVCAIGYRADSDWASKVKKVRFSKEEIILEV